MQLEIADVFLNDLVLDGSLLVLAKNVLGHDSQGIVRYSHNTGKCVLKNVRVKNKGINRKTTRRYWKNQIKRHEALKIILQGHSEFYAENITFEGDQTLVVPHGERWVAHRLPTAKLSIVSKNPVGSGSTKKRITQSSSFTIVSYYSFPSLTRNSISSRLLPFVSGI